MLSTLKDPAYNPASAMQSNCYKNKKHDISQHIIGFVLEVLKVLGRQCRVSQKPRNPYRTSKHPNSFKTQYF